LWEWCGACHIFEHLSARKPDGWNPEYTLMPQNLTAEPTAIVDALLAAQRDRRG